MKEAFASATATSLMLCLRIEKEKGTVSKHGQIRHEI